MSHQLLPLQNLHGLKTMIVPRQNVAVLFAMTEFRDYELVIKEDDKQELLEWLYRFDKRHRKAHPLHGLYTGLALKYKNLFTV